VDWGLLLFFIHSIISLINAFSAHDFFKHFIDGVGYAFVRGLMAFTDMPLWLWDWAKFSHPWLAFFISIPIWWIFLYLGEPENSYDTYRGE